MKDISNLSIEQLRDRHQAVYDEFAPTVRKYSEMASEVLLIQIELFKRRLADEFDARRWELTEICAVSARAPLEKFESVLAELNKQKIEPAAIIYDPITFTFRFFGKVPATEETTA